MVTSDSSLSQTNLSSFFKRKDSEDFSSPPISKKIKRSILKSPTTGPRTPEKKIVTDRTRHWQLGSESPIEHSPKKDANHQRFVERLGDPTKFVRKPQVECEESEDGGSPEVDEDDNEELEEESELSKRFTRTAKNSTKKTKLQKMTPLEQQYLEIRAANPNTLLFIGKLTLGGD